MGAILEVRGVSISFGGVEALKDVSLKVEEGSLTGLIGPNGSGKSTLFNVITGIYRPNSGVVLFQGKRIDGLNPNEVYDMGIARTFQNPRPFGSMTVLENLMLSPKGQRGESIIKAPMKRFWLSEELDIASNVKDLMSQIGMLDVYKTYASDLSGGHTKMLETGKGILGGARLILLDEPTAGVHYAVGRRVFEHINSLRKQFNLTYFVIEHRIDILFNFADYIYVLHMGRLIAEGKPEEVATNPEVIKAYIGGG